MTAAHRGSQARRSRASARGGAWALRSPPDPMRWRLTLARHDCRASGSPARDHAPISQQGAPPLPPTPPNPSARPFTPPRTETLKANTTRLAERNKRQGRAGGGIPTTQRRQEKLEKLLKIKGKNRTLNQRVQGSNPCAPTNEIKGLLGPPTQKIPQKAFWFHLSFVTSIETAFGAG